MTEVASEDKIGIGICSPDKKNKKDIKILSKRRPNSVQNARTDTNEIEKHPAEDTFQRFMLNEFLDAVDNEETMNININAHTY